MEQSCTTTTKATAAISHSWIIQNFTLFHENMKLRSMVFTGTSPDSQPVSWFYTLEIQIRNSSNRSVVIEMFGDSTYVPRSRLFAKTEFQLFGYNFSCSGLFQPNAQIGKSITAERTSYHSSSIGNNDVLTLRFNCTLYEEIVNGNRKQPGPAKQLPDAQLVDHFGGLLASNKFSDVTLIVGKKSFPAHKAILAARSSVFEAMFKHEMQETKENTVKITDVKPEVLQEILRFIYTGTVQRMDKLAGELLMAAEKYALDNLKTKCGEHLGSNLSVETATSTLALAEKYNARELKQQAIQFISKNVKQLNPTDWKEVLTNNFDVAAEIIAQVVKEK